MGFPLQITNSGQFLQWRTAVLQLRAISDSQDADIRVSQIVAFPQYGPVGEHRPVPFSHSRSFMNMPEQMKFRTNQRQATPKDGISIVNLIRKVKDEPTNNVGEPIRTDIEPINDNDEPIKDLISSDSLSI